jgi:hypothetical protein
MNAVWVAFGVGVVIGGLVAVIVLYAVVHFQIRGLRKGLRLRRYVGPSD